MMRGVSHTEFIKGEDGRFYFLETAARVGGANIEQLVESASGINLWAEWAKLEIAYARGGSYIVPEDTGDTPVCLFAWHARSSQICRVPGPGNRLSYGKETPCWINCSESRPIRPVLKLAHRRI